MRVQACATPFTGRTVHKHAKKGASRSPQPLQVARQAAVVLTTLAVLASPQVAEARLELPNKEVDNDSSPWIQEMLRRTAEKKEERYKERLNDYYKRNFKEYFEFEGQNINVGKRRGLSDETARQITEWLEKNK